jgi:hypothetical protein|nr:MAG TPA: acetyl-coA carboxylase zinc finger domain protein [Caudoviricetes sp.]
MAKKKKKNKIDWFSQYETGKKKDKKRKEKKSDKHVMYNGPKLKAVKPTLDRKEVRAAQKAAKEPAKIADAIVSAKNKCNHCQEMLTVEEFAKKYPVSQHIAPMLNEYIAEFGEENVRVCGACFTPVVSRDVINPKEVKRSFLIVDGTLNHLMANMRMSKKELKFIKKSVIRTSEMTNTVVPMLEELREKEEAVRTNQPAKTAVGGPAPANHNTSSGGLAIPEGVTF